MSEGEAAKPEVIKPEAAKPEVIKPEGAKVCQGPACPLCTPLGLALFLVGFMTVFYAPRPYNTIGWVIVLLAYLQGFFKNIFK